MKATLGNTNYITLQDSSQLLLSVILTVAIHRANLVQKYLSIFVLMGMHLDSFSWHST